MSFKHPVRIVHLVRAVDIGGLERVVLDLVTHRSKDRFDVSVLCLENRGELAKKFEAAGVPVLALQLQNKSLGRRVWTLSRCLRQLQPDVLHTHNSGPHFNGALAAKVAGVPVLVHTKHGRNYVNSRRKLLQNRIASRLSSRIVPVSHDAASVARELEHVPEGAIEVVHNGIDFDQFTSRNDSRSDDSGVRAVHVARLNQVKDQPTLLRAVRMVVDEMPAFELDVIGDGPAREKVLQLSAELDLDQHVHFHGMRDDVPYWLERADLFVLSSVSEGICLTLLEAMAAGLPIVATDVGGNREVVEDGRTGWLVPPGDPRALADAILRYCRDADTARAMGQRGRVRVQQEFSVKSMVARYEAMYVELLQFGGAPLPLSRSKERRATTPFAGSVAGVDPEVLTHSKTR